jgi:hypothetical protein
MRNRLLHDRTTLVAGAVSYFVDDSLKAVSCEQIGQRPGTTDRRTPFVSMMTILSFLIELSWQTDIPTANRYWLKRTGLWLFALA